MKKWLLVVAMLAFAVSMAQAGVVEIYRESFVGDGPDPEDIDTAGIGWTGASWIYVGTREGFATGANKPPASIGGGVLCPEGDEWYGAKGEWESPQHTTRTFERPILAVERTGLCFQVDWAGDRDYDPTPGSETGGGMAFIAEVGGKWYRSENLAVVAGARGSVQGREYRVNEWVADTTVYETDNWYEYTANGGVLPERPGRLDENWAAVGALPAGDISGFGLWLNNRSDWHGFAFDNYRILNEEAAVVVPEPATLALLGVAALGLLIRRK